MSVKAKVCEIAAEMFLVAMLALLLFSNYIVAKETLRIGYLNGMELGLDRGTISPTIDFLRNKNPNYDIKIFQISPVDTLSEIKGQKLDFFIAPSTFFVELSDELSVNHLATRKTLKAKNPSKSVGSVFIAKSDNKNINDFADMKGRKCVASLPNSLGGWLAAQRELLKKGYDPEKFFSKVTFTQYQTPDVFNAVLSGKADIGILSTCVLEQAIQEGLIEENSLKVIGAQNSNSDLACIYSTEDLYPDIVFLSFDKARDSAVRNITLSLLAMPSFGDYWWTLGNDYLSIRNMLKDLKLGPYSYLRDTSVSSLIKRFKAELFVAFILVSIIIFDEIRLHWLVKRRTRQLTKALALKDEADKIARQERKNLSILERNGVISQMGSILAHEAKQPIGTILNYMEVLRMQLATETSHNTILNKVLSSIDAEVLRLNELIDTVRNYAKKKENKKVPTNLIEIAKNAIKTFERNDPQLGIKIIFKSNVPSATVKADLLAFELLILNLIRNGAHAAVEGFKKQGIPAKVGVKVEDNPISSKYKLVVWNTGTEVSPEDMHRMVSLGESIKPEGLGLGLSIIRNIADSHAATISFKKRYQGGIEAEVLVDKFTDSEKNNGSSAVKTTMSD